MVLLPVLIALAHMGPATALRLNLGPGTEHHALQQELDFVIQETDEPALNECFKPKELQKLKTKAKADLASCAKYYSSCMSLWQNEIFMRLRTGIYCYAKFISSLPPDARQKYRVT